MQIIFDEDDIKAALTAHATSMVTVKEDMEITIDMKAGRGENGYSATLNIQPKAAPVTTKTTRTKPAVVETTAAAPKPVAAKAGLFTKPTAVETAPEPVPEEAPEAELPPEEETNDVIAAGISTGEDRGEAAEELNQDLDVPEEAPAEKPKSIFNFAKPAAAAGA